MKKLSAISLAVVAAALWAPRASADVTVAQHDDWHLELGAMGQVLGLGESVNDPYKQDLRAYLFVKEARVRATGGYKDYTLDLELGLASEDVVVAPNPGVSLSLLDFALNVPLHGLGKSFIRVGQFKVPYGREGLTYSGNTQFIDRSIDYLGFVVGRDVGVSLNLRGDRTTLIAGVFTGGGRDVPQEYLPENLGVPLFVVRAGYGDVDDNPYYLKQNDFDAKKTKAAIFLNGLYTKDTQIGHSTVLNVKLADKSLLLNGNWNPFIGKSPMKPGEWWQYGADAAVRQPLGGDAQLSAEVEANFGGYSNAYGSLHMAGGRGQAAFYAHQFEVAFRYAFLLPDKGFANGGQEITGSGIIQEVTPAVSYYIRGHQMKVMADLPVLVNVPVFTETKVGSYVATQLPNQATVLANEGTVRRQTVPVGRLMFQAQF